MHAITFKLTLICCFVITIFARAGEGQLPTGDYFGSIEISQSAFELTLSSHTDTGATSEPCACGQMPGSKISLTCGVVLAMPVENLSLKPPMCQAGKWKVRSRSGLKLFLPIQKKPPRVPVSI